MAIIISDQKIAAFSLVFLCQANIAAALLSVHFHCLLQIKQTIKWFRNPGPSCFNAAQGAQPVASPMVPAVAHFECPQHCRMLCPNTSQCTEHSSEIPGLPLSLSPFRCFQQFLDFSVLLAFSSFPWKTAERICLCKLCSFSLLWLLGFHNRTTSAFQNCCYHANCTSNTSWYLIWVQHLCLALAHLSGHWGGGFYLSARCWASCFLSFGSGLHYTCVLLFFPRHLQLSSVRDQLQGWQELWSDTIQQFLYIVLTALQTSISNCRQNVFL